MLNSEKTLLLAKIESNYGVNPSPAIGTDTMFVVGSPKIAKLGDIKKRNLLIGVFGNTDGLAKYDGIEISFDVEINAPANATTAPAIGCLLRACNFTEAIAANVTYTPNSTIEGESVTLKLYKDAHYHVATGCRGSFEITGKSNEVITISFKFTGLYDTSGFATAEAFPTIANVVYPTGAPWFFNSSTFAVNSTAEVIENFKFTLGNDVVKRPSANAATGVSGYVITNRHSKATFDPEAVALTTRNWWSMQDNNTNYAIALSIANGSRTLAMAIARSQVVKAENASRNGILTYDIEVECNPTALAGNTELILTFS